MNISKNRTVMIQLIAVILLAMPASGAPPAPSSSESVSYEIPLSDLKKVEKKKKAKKSENRHRKEKKQSNITGQNASKETAETKAASGTHTSSPEISYPLAMPEAQTLPREAASEQPPKASNSNVASPPATADETRIIHDPYSYVVTGKLTTIKTIFSSRYGLKSVQCQFRSSEAAEYAIVPMSKVDGSQYTYAATIPALDQGAQSLRYRFVTIDTQGRETRSQEFVTLVNQTTVVPGWQQNPSQEAIKVDPGNSVKPFEGFPDATVTK